MPPTAPPGWGAPPPQGPPWGPPSAAPPTAPPGQPAGWTGWPPPAPGWQAPPVPPRAPYASFGIRLLARIIDALILGVPFVIIFSVLAAALPKEDRFGTIDGELSICHGPTGGSVAVLLLVGLLWFVLTVAYFVGLVGTRGATVGQNALKIQVVGVADGETIGIGRATGRYLMSIVSAWPCYLGYLWMLWDDRRQTWQDKVASSIVVRL
jgi:uncharacterized RDD family membrane protein YckC